MRFILVLSGQTGHRLLFRLTLRVDIVGGINPAGSIPSFFVSLICSYDLTLVPPSGSSAALTPLRHSADVAHSSIYIQSLSVSLMADDDTVEREQLLKVP